MTAHSIPAASRGASAGVTVAHALSLPSLAAGAPATSVNSVAPSP